MGLLIAIAVGVGLWLWSGDPAEPRPAPPAPDAQPAAPAAGVPAQAEAPTPPSEPEAPSAPPTTGPRGEPLGKITFPDGSVRDAINGVTEDIEMLWDDGVPFSPIVDTVYDNGWWWWKHADGETWTTVQVVPVNGVPKAVPIYNRVSEKGVVPTREQFEQQLQERRQQQQGSQPLGPTRPGGG
ncbi:MAG: hypothetical protein AB7O84_07315 [Planctomycetota bacterium]